ncbi:unnamed protein product [Absidia cylindrospora]
MDTAEPIDNTAQDIQKDPNANHHRGSSDQLKLTDTCIEILHSSMNDDENEQQPTRTTLASKLDQHNRFLTHFSKVAHHQQQTVDSVQLGNITQIMEQTISHLVHLDPIERYAELVQHSINQLPSTSSLPEREIVQILAIIVDALEMIAKLFDLLSSGLLDKKILCENLIMTCLQLVRNQLDNIVYPLIDMDGYGDVMDDLTGNPHLLIKLANSDAKVKRLLSRILPLVSLILRRSYFLLQLEDIDDHVLVVLVFISLGPFFHDSIAHPKSSTPCPVITPINHTINDLHYSARAYTTSATTDNHHTTGKSSVLNTFEHLKLVSLDLLQHSFSQFPQHRHWILQEILSNIGSLTTMDYGENKRFRILQNTMISTTITTSSNNSDTDTIHIVSALFMQLIQSCCYNVKDDRQAHKTWLTKWDLKYQKTEGDVTKRKDLEQALVNRAQTVWKKGIDQAVQNTTYFLEFLMNKCKSRKKNGYSVMEYRTILECTIEDILTVLNDPDWPVAELILHVFSKILVGFTDSDTGDLYLRTIAIEWLGTIAARIKTGLNRIAGAHGSYTPEWLYQLNKNIPLHGADHTATTLQLMDRCRMKVYQCLIEEGSDENTQQFYLATWGYGCAGTLKSTLEKIQDSTDDLENDLSVPTELASALQSSCHRYWLLSLGLEAIAPNQSRYEFPELNRDDLQLITELLATRSSLFQNINLFMSKLLACLDKNVVAFRIKAIRAIGQITASAPEIWEEAHIHQAVVQRIYDVSPSVRDAAVELIAKYLSTQQEISTKLYGILSSRIMDTAPNVRKRVVKLLPDLYDKCDDLEIKIDIGAKLLQRMDDNEISIQKIALKAAQKVLFSPFHSIDQDKDNSFGQSFGNSSKARKQKIADWTNLITSTVAKLNGSVSGRNAILTGFIQKTIEKADDKLQKWYETIFQWIVESLFEKMLVLDESGNTMEFFHCMATIHAFTKACPTLLTETQVYTLLPYLTVSESDDWTIGQYVMVLYRDVLPRLKHGDLEFAHMVEGVLLQTLGKCPSHVIHDAVSCLCAIVGNISHRYSILIKMLGSCLASIQHDKQMAIKKNLVSKPLKTAKALMICGFLCQYFDFDEKRARHADSMTELDKIDKGKITSFVFGLLLYFAKDVIDDKNGNRQIKLASLTALGSLYASHPTFMITPQSTDLLDNIFELDDVELKIKLMDVFLCFLNAEETRIQRRAEACGDSLYSKTIDVETLLGNTEEFAELGANGSLMQRYLPSILKCALGSTNQLRLAAFDVIETVINQGLAHPMMCMPAIVAAETSPDTVLRNKAYYLHIYIHNKFGNILYSQMDANLKSAYDYQKLLCGTHIKGFGKRGGDEVEEALLGVTYSVLKEKKNARIEFLLNLVKPFNIDIKHSTTMPHDFVEMDYLTFLADNLLTLPLSTSDELYCVLHAMDRILITAGGALLPLVQHYRKEGVVSVLSYMDDDDDGDDEDDDSGLDQEYMTTAKCAITMMILIRTKEALKALYNIDDQEIQGYQPNSKHKSHTLTKDLDENSHLDWKELAYFRLNKLNSFTASDACLAFEKRMDEADISINSATDE